MINHFKMSFLFPYSNDSVIRSFVFPEHDEYSSLRELYVQTLLLSLFTCVFSLILSGSQLAIHLVTCYLMTSAGKISMHWCIASCTIQGNCWKLRVEAY